MTIIFFIIVLDSRKKNVVYSHIKLKIIIFKVGTFEKIKIILKKYQITYIDCDYVLLAVSLINPFLMSCCCPPDYHPMTKPLIKPYWLDYECSNQLLKYTFKFILIHKSFIHK